MVKVAVIVSKMNSGGTKNLIMEYLRHIDTSVIKIDFICDSDSKAIPYEEIYSYGSEVFLVPPYQNILRNMQVMYKVLKNNNYDIVHAYNSTMNIFPMFVSKMAHVPVRISESLSMAHEGELKTFIKKILRPMSKLFATHYMACGEECGRWQFGDKIFDEGKVTVFKTVIDTKVNAFDPVVRNKTRLKYELDNKMVIGHIGRFVPQKNSLFILDVFYEICKIKSNAILLLIGDGMLREKMLAKIDKMHLNNNVVYLGGREDIQQFYNAMDAFLLPSLYEGLPVVGLEAQSCGLPVFFSTEITKEVGTCDLAHFIKLDESPCIWAKEIVEAVNKNILERTSRDDEVRKNGFDSRPEAIRLQEYYLDICNEV